MKTNNLHKENKLKKIIFFVYANYIITYTFLKSDKKKNVSKKS